MYFYFVLLNTTPFYSTQMFYLLLRYYSSLTLNLYFIINLELFVSTFHNLEILRIKKIHWIKYIKQMEHLWWIGGSTNCDYHFRGVCFPYVISDVYSSNYERRFLPRKMRNIDSLHFLKLFQFILGCFISCSFKEPFYCIL